MPWSTQYIKTRTEWKEQVIPQIKSYTARTDHILYITLVEQLTMIDVRSPSVFTMTPEWGRWTSTRPSGSLRTTTGLPSLLISLKPGTKLCIRVLLYLSIFSSLTKQLNNMSTQTSKVQW